MCDCSPFCRRLSDDEEYFYAFIDGLLKDWSGKVPPAKALVRMVQAKGAGYAMSRCAPYARLDCIACQECVICLERSVPADTC